MTLFLMILIVGLIVAIHELGHFLAAKAVKAEVRTFSIFFGPALYKRQIGETLFKIGCIPLGGYVSIPGAFGHDKTDAELLEPRRKDETKEEHADRLSKIDKSRWLSRKSIPAQIFVMLSGVLANLLSVILVLTVMFSIWGKWDDRGASSIAGVRDGSPAALAGIRPGDEIVRVNGKEIDASTSVVSLIRGTGPAVTLEVKQGSEVRSLTLQRSPLLGGIVGIEIEPAMVRVSPVEAVGSACQLVVEATRDFVLRVANVPRFVEHQRDHGQGIVGAVALGNEVIAADISKLPGIFVLLSIAIGLVQLLPLPALDGGRIVMALFGKLRQNDAVAATMQLALLASAIFLISWSLFVNARDVTRLMP